MGLSDAVRSRNAERAGDQTVWRDASAVLAAACVDMQSGQLLHGESFSLFESMAALQMMDPKMDAGMGGGREGQGEERGEAESVGEAVGRGLVPLPLPADRLVDLCDAVLCAEATWHSGHSLAQTVFTCAYLLLPPLSPHAPSTPHSPSPLAAMPHPSLASSPLLLALLSSVLASVNCARTAACRSDQREEEDFVTSALGLPLEGGVGEAGVAKLRALLGEVEGIGAEEREGKGEGAVGKAVGVEVAVGDERAFGCVLHALPPQLLTALIARIRFRLALFDALSSLQAARLPSHLPACALKVRQAQAALQALNDSPPPSTSTQPPATAASADAAASASPAGGTTAAGGTEGGGQAGEGGGQTASGRAAVGMCPAINRHLLAPTPPRPTSLLTWREALSHFARLLDHLATICLLPSSSPPDLLSLTRFLSHLRSSDPGPVARALLQLLLLRDGRILGCEPPLLLMASLRLPLTLLPPTLGGGAAATDGGGAALTPFVNKATYAVQAVLRALCANSARERRQLAKLLPDWNHLLTLAGDVDASEAVQRYCTTTFSQGWWRDSVATSWVVEHTCRIVIRYLLLGFSSLLYAPSEFLSVFWYVDSVLATLIHNVSAREAGVQQPVTTLSSRKGRRKAPPPSQPSPPQPSLDLALLSLHHLLCKAYVRMLAALSLDGKLPHRLSPFNTDYQRYQQRFEVLKRLQLPEPLSFAAFHRSVSPAVLSVPELYQMSLDFFRSAVNQLPTVQALAAAAAGADAAGSDPVVLELQQLERVCACNCTALFVAHRAGSGSVLRASFEFSSHPFFPVVALKRA